MGAIQQWLNRCLALINKSQSTIGHKAEAYAAQFLKREGLKVLEKNFSCQFGEIDLIVQEAETLVFVEVKFRTDSDWADAIETVTKTKQQKIIKAAKHYKQKHKISDYIACRFDVIAINNEFNAENTEWLKHAFY